ncbi:MAG TPA: 3TM-type holin, partial [Arenibaculum sp.]|nr:3TM-type holin [Arenibaculum sp.]
IGLPLLIQAVRGGLRKVEHPAAAGAADALDMVAGAMRDGGISEAAVAEANRHVERMAELESADYRGTIGEVNRSLRAETASHDAYVRRMRPTFGYIMALSWCAQMLAVAWVIVSDPAQAGAVVAALASLGTIWTVGLSVLGVYVYKRSEDKKVAAGQSAGTGALDRLVRRLADGSR